MINVSNYNIMRLEDKLRYARRDLAELTRKSSEVITDIKAIVTELARRRETEKGAVKAKYPS